MRILVVSDLPQFFVGGAEMQAARLIEAWLDAGHEVRCFGRRMGSSPVTIGRHSIEVRRIHVVDALGRLGRMISYFFSLAWLLLGHRRWADVVYTRFLGEAAATAAMLKSLRLLKQPLVSTPANTHGAGDVQFLHSIPFARTLVRLLDGHCDAINLIAEDMADELRSAGFSGRNFSHIPNGIAMRPPPPQRDAGPLAFIVMGRLARQKAIDVLLHACARLRSQPNGRDWKLVIAGDGPERENLHALANMLELGPHIEWLGEVAPAQVADHLDRAHVFLLPSRYEGMSNAGLEAMERGLPVVLSRCGGLDHCIDSSMGWVVPVENETALADALDTAIRKDQRQLDEMGAAARRHVEREFDIRVTSRRYLDLFQSLLGDGRNAR